MKGAVVQVTGEFDSIGIGIDPKGVTSVEITIPNSEDPTWSSNVWSKDETVKLCWAEIFQIWKLKGASFGLLKAKHSQ